MVTPFRVPFPEITVGRLVAVQKSEPVLINVIELFFLMILGAGLLAPSGIELGDVDTARIMCWMLAAVVSGEGDRNGTEMWGTS